MLHLPYCKIADGTEADGTEADGTEADDTEADGTEADGTEADGTEMSAVCVDAGSAEGDAPVDSAGDAVCDHCSPADHTSRE